MRLALLTGLVLIAAAGSASLSRAQPEAPKLAFPVACVIGKTCEIQHYVDRDPDPGAIDYRCGHRTYNAHDGIDIRLLDMAAQRAGVDVLAAAAGRVVAVRDGVPDISIRDPNAPSVVGHECGNRVGVGLGNGWIIDYCHLAKGSLKVKVGDAVAAGQPLAHVGLSGDTEFPHVHFSVRHANALVDPFAPAAAGGCAKDATSLWSPAVAAQMPYRRGVVLNAGFSAAVTTNAEIEDRRTLMPTPDAGAIVAYARAIGLELGDVIDITLQGPDGKALATTTLPPLDHDKDQFIAQVGRKRPLQGWPHGVYAGEFHVRRGGAIALTHHWQVTL